MIIRIAITDDLADLRQLAIRAFINALFERRGFKYIAIHTGYWLITLAIIGGLMCQFAM